MKKITEAEYSIEAIAPTVEESQIEIPPLFGSEESVSSTENPTSLQHIFIPRVLAAVMTKFAHSRVKIRHYDRYLKYSCRNLCMSLYKKSRQDTYLWMWTKSVDTLSFRIGQRIFRHRNLVTEISIFMALLIYGLGYFVGRASIMFLGTTVSIVGLLLWCSPLYGKIYLWCTRAMGFLHTKLSLKFTKGANRGS